MTNHWSVTEPDAPATRGENPVAVTAPVPAAQPERDDRQTDHEPPPPIEEQGDGESYEGGRARTQEKRTRRRH